MRTFRPTIERQHVRVLAFVVLFTSLAVMLWWGMTTQTNARPVVLIPPDPSLYATATPPLVASEEEEPPLTAHRSEPMVIRIPSIELVAPFEGAMFLNDDGTIEVPSSFETVGWYGYGPMPGELGPAVILGHVDSYKGPAVLYALREVSPNDRIEIERSDGSTAVFSVTDIEMVAQGSFPTQRVYGDISYAGLRIITCSGTYDRGIRRYSHNLIVYATLVDVVWGVPQGPVQPPVEMLPTDTLQ